MDSLHKKEKNSICWKCQVCVCDTSYQTHQKNSPECSLPPLMLKDEFLGQKSQVNNLEKEIVDFKKTFKEKNEKIKFYIEDLEADCDSKCKKIIQTNNDLVQNILKETEKLCKDLRELTKKQVKKWHDLLKENENILKELELWEMNLQSLCSKVQEDIDFTQELESLDSKLSQLNKSNIPIKKYQLEASFFNKCIKLKESLNKFNSSISLSVKELDLKREWTLPNPNSYISSIHISCNDNHIFLCDCENSLIIEYSELGELVYEHKLTDGTNEFTPFEICTNVPNNFLVLCNRKNTIISLERTEMNPSLKVKEKIDVDNKKISSLCKGKENLLVCDVDCDVYYYAKDMKKIKKIKTKESDDKGCPLIRFDSSTGNFWMSLINSSEVVCFNRKGKEIRSIKFGKIICDFCVNEFGILYFCNFEEIFSSLPTKTLYKFDKKAENLPQISVLGKKLFICFKIGGKYSIKIFKIL